MPLIVVATKADPRVLLLLDTIVARQSVQIALMRDMKEQGAASLVYLKRIAELLEPPPRVVAGVRIVVGPIEEE